VIAPSYDSASTTVEVATSINARPSGAPFWIWFAAPGKSTVSAPGAGSTAGSITTRY
jgi:hypothetical protein